IRGDLKRMKRDTTSGKTEAAPPSVSIVSEMSSAHIPLQKETASSSILLAEALRHKGLTIGATVAALMLMGAASVGLYNFVSKSRDVIDTQKITLQQLTDHRQVVPGSGIAVSPDGKWLAYVKREAQRSLRVRQIATGNEISVVPAQSGLFFGI